MKYKSVKDWLDDTLIKFNEVMLSDEDKKKIEEWNKQLMQSWNELQKK